MFEFLKKKTETTTNEPEEVNEDDILASITYYYTKDKEASVDISVASYDQESVDAMCALLNLLSGGTFYLETIDMLKDGLIRNGQEVMLINILTHISEHSRQKILKEQEDKLIDEPCIKPSSMVN